MGSEITILKQMNNLGFGPFGSITLNLVFTVSLGEGIKQKKLEFSNFLAIPLEQQICLKCNAVFKLNPELHFNLSIISKVMVARKLQR